MATEQTIKVSTRNYEFIKQVAEKGGYSIKQVVDLLVSEGLDIAKELGKAKHNPGSSDLAEKVEKLERALNDLREALVRFKKLRPCVIIE